MPGEMTPLAVHSTDFWDEDALLKEERRQFDVCQACRLCWNFCPAFPALFEKTDAVNADMGKVTRKDLRIVEDSCYQCKLCFIRCPYTPPHALRLDVPTLMVRARLVNARKDGVKWQDRVLADTDLVGKLGSWTAPLSNIGNASAPARAVMEGVLGIHRNAHLPLFHQQTFVDWFKDNEQRLRLGLPSEARKAALFYGCTVNHNAPQVGAATAEVLAHNGVWVTVPRQQCCGMPFLDAGALDATQRKVEANVKSLASAVRQGCDIVATSPSCSLMLKKEYPDLASGEDSTLVAQHTFDASEYLWKLKTEGKLKTQFPNQRFRARVKSIAYHAPCHIRAQFMGNKAANLMELVPEMRVEQIERCSHHDGTWGVKKASYEVSMQYGEKLFQAMKDAEADLFVTDCPLAALHIEHGTGTRPVHPMQVLKEAYGI